MAFLKNVLCAAACAVGLGFAGSSFAEVITFNNASTVITSDNLVNAGKNFVETIKKEKGSLYSKLQFVSVGNYLGSYTIDEATNQVTQITVASLPTLIKGVPAYPFDYKPTLTMSATISNKCTTITDEQYSISDGSGIVNPAFQADLVEYGRQLFMDLLKDSGLKNNCN
ncbi:MAG: hypothetical protein V4591_05790 [Bdellovibrionota bacterium]